MSVAGKLSCIGSMPTANPRRAPAAGMGLSLSPRDGAGLCGRVGPKASCCPMPQRRDCLLHNSPLRLIQVTVLEVMFESSSWEDVGRPLQKALRTEGQGHGVPPAPWTSQMAPKRAQKEADRVCPGDIPGKSTEINQTGLFWVNLNSTVKPEQVSWPNCSR